MRSQKYSEGKLQIRDQLALASGSGLGMNSGSEQKIQQWVKAHYKSETVGGETVYNLSEPTS